MDPAPLLDTVSDLLGRRYLSSGALAKRWGFHPQTLANLRHLKRGPAYTVLGERSVRYSMTEALAWELRGESAHVTRDRLELACATLPEAIRAQVLTHLIETLFPSK